MANPFSTEALLSDRFAEEEFASSHYARIAKAHADAAEFWNRVALASAKQDPQVELLKSKARQATARANALTPSN